jgi:hypothetical protein
MGKLLCFLHFWWGSLGRDVRRIIVILLSFLMTFTASMDAFAQSQSCSALARQIKQYERHPDFRGGKSNDSTARTALKEIKKWESQFVRQGCQKLVNNKKKLNSTCRSVARKILRLRQDYSNAVASVKKGSQIAAAREAALQEYARFGCSSGKKSASSKEPERKTLFERLFGGNDDETISEGDFYQFNRTTYRTVCVRSCDGYYWPVSFSTVKDNVYQDAGACEAQSPNGDYRLFYYENRSGSPETMIDLNGQPYANEPFAFRFRREYDPACVVKPQSAFGTIKAGEDGDFSTAVISFGDLTFPLPRRDPRQSVEVTIATASYVPLPRPRPDREGKGKVNVVATQSNADYRMVTVGEKTIRIVGPDTPYVPKAATGS